MKFKNAHNDAEKTEISCKIMNTIIKNDRVVNKIIYIENKGKIYQVS